MTYNPLIINKNPRITPNNNNLFSVLTNKIEDKSHNQDTIIFWISSENKR